MLVEQLKVKALVCATTSLALLGNVVARRCSPLGLNSLCLARISAWVACCQHQSMLIAYRHHNSTGCTELPTANLVVVKRTEAIAKLCSKA